MVTNDSLTAKDMVGLLRSHYIPEGRPEGGIFAPGIGSPDGHRVADAIWQSTTRSGGLLLVGHEIKVSRADVAVELADPSKAEAWMQYCDKWWLTVSDPDLVEGFDIPDSWGIMSPPSGRRKRSMTIIKEAPALKPVNKEPALVRLLTWHDFKQKENRQDLIREKFQLETHISQLEYQVKTAKAGKPLSWEEQFVSDVYDAYTQRILNEGIERAYLGPETDKNDFVDALIDMHQFRLNAQKLNNATRTAMYSMEGLDRAMVEARKLARDIKKQTEG
jgi:hypothetical protein